MNEDNIEGDNVLFNASPDFCMRPMGLHTSLDSDLEAQEDIPP